MTGSGGHFSGSQRVAPVGALDAFARTAKPGDEFVYCEAPDLVRCETSTRARELVQAGVIRTHQRRRAGGGWEYFAVRTRYKPPAPVTPAAAALADPATDSIFRQMKRAANLNLPCPSDAQLARSAGLESRKQSAWRVRRLVDAGLIESTLAYEGGVPTRVVTICCGPHAGTAGGKFTALPKKWAALQAAAARELKAGTPVSATYPRGRSGAL